MLIIGIFNVSHASLKNEEKIKTNLKSHFGLTIIIQKSQESSKSKGIKLMGVDSTSLHVMSYIPKLFIYSGCLTMCIVYYVTVLIINWLFS